MSVLEPVAAAVLVPGKSDTVVDTVPHEQQPVVELAVLDHVTSHSIKCYWDFVECRWRCSDR